MTQAYQARLNAELAQWSCDGLRRRLDQRHGSQGAVVEIDGRELINFTSNDYLGLAADRAVLQAVRDALPAHGFGAGAAALLSGRSSAHAELEQRLAAFTGAQSALLFSSGYLANTGALPALIKRGDYVAHDRLNHASLIDGVLASTARHQRYRHLDMAHLEQQLSAASSAQSRFIVSESLFSMDGDRPDLAALSALADDHQSVLYIDDAHGFGLSHGGRGAAGELQLGSSGDSTRVVMLTLGKALGSIGAAVLAPHAVTEYLVQRARTYVYDTALPAVCAVAALAALERLSTDAGLITRLTSNIELFRTEALAHDLPLMAGDSPIQPLVIGQPDAALNIAESLLQAGYYIRAIRPPTVPRNTARLRITITAAHDPQQIKGLLAALAERWPR